ncbi:MAG TPA: porin family protein [Gemmatimonadaceae bacterium]|nr:porin family protein [Gemmatimonadaceae bacterium]
MARQRVAARAAVAVLLFTVLSSPSAYGQGGQSVAHRANYGVLAGINFATLGGSDVQDAKTRTAFSGGAYAALPVGTGTAIQAELLYSMEGAKTNTGSNGALKLDYVRVPVMLRFAVPTAGTTRPFVAVGPSFGFQTRCEFSGSTGGVSVTESCDDVGATSGDFERKKLDVSGRLEGGLTFDTGGRRLILGGSYSHGFTDVFKNSDGKNRVFSIFVGVGL